MSAGKNQVVSIPIEQAALFAQGLVIPLMALLTIPYVWVKLNGTGFEEAIQVYLLEIYYSVHSGTGVLRSIFSPFIFLLTPFDNPVLFGIALILGVPIHEILHALPAMILSGKGFKAVTFGFHKKSMAPYTHFREPLKIWKYKIVLMLPGIILGVIPGILAIITSHPALMIFAFFYLFGALGDLFVLKILNNFKNHQLVKDHPETLGFIIVK